MAGLGYPRSRSPRYRRAVLAAFLIAVHACDLPTEPAFPPDAVPFEPPAAYAAWWDLTSACSGAAGDFAAVRWFVVPGTDRIPFEGREYQGLWFKFGNRIVLAEESVMRGALVRHEMLHALIDHAGHPRAYYRERCGGVVVCVGGCEAETGGDARPAAGGRVLLPSDLRMSLQVLPGPLPEHGEGWVGVLVSVTNPLGEPGVIRLPAQGAFTAPSFGYALAKSGGTAAETYHFVSGTEMAFAPGETRRHLFDLWLAPSEWEVRGLFGGLTTTSVRFGSGN